MTTLASAFVNRIYPLGDIRYQLPANFGHYLADIPCRLGINPALDAASDALVAAHTRFCAGQATPEHDVLTKYSRALSVVRRELADEARAHSSETLCAIMLLMIVQSMTCSFQESMASHSEGATLILKSRGLFGPRDDFESKLLLTLRGPVVMEALDNPNIQLSRQEWNDLVKTPLEDVDAHTVWLKCLACVPDLMQRGTAALHQDRRPEVLLDLVNETISLLEDCKANITMLRERFTDPDFGSSQVGMLAQSHPSRLLVYSQYMRLLALALTTGIILSCILCALQGNNVHVSEEVSQWSKEIFQLAELGVPFQPLGSMGMIICLPIAWIGAADQDSREKIKALLADYKAACLGLSSRDLATALERTKRRFTLMRPGTCDRFYWCCS